MEICNSKAYYLNNYGLRRKVKSLTDKTLPMRAELCEGIRIRKLTRPHYISHKPSELYTEHVVLTSTDSKSSFLSKSKEDKHIFKKERDILKKVVDKKNNQTRHRRSKTDFNNYVILQRHPLGGVTPLEVEAMKPTQRYFHHMQNVRMAQKLLLVNATLACSTQSQKKFYKQQSEYKTNITKLMSRTKKNNEVSRLRMLNRSKWIT